MHNFILSDLADTDVFDILDYSIDKWGYEQADKYQCELEQGRLQVQNNPYLIGSKSRKDLAQSCRSYLVN
jgi:plasmid stabilization system protein ParE